MESPELTRWHQESLGKDQTATAMQPRLPDDVEKEAEYNQLWTTERRLLVEHWAEERPEPTGR
ncbi:hypothetical protein PF005_g32519 [Phytophthora fragariae]|uniref:Uncharacterized protein n=1 Tax=Phytophthora fragariae TaxID=53985 RepID=A0A6A3PMD9_9STRA|nr:hypothetical protein PF009_g32453 [Phytophthora fragariae]KAE9057409.1 hypothetical protein PF006_g32423 [Phytophthora fragariae]KAE9158263.1 hypothetical protein PF005_g32519 [Phytophthora fragariae]KAE9187277.1 hypothetical protein PF004_g22847 [Phytophthora fragariae]KAE9264510.1 hypothetical protein PF008_g32102 [Phytophthora fragariae]